MSTRTDPTFYRTASHAMSGPPERHGYVVTLDPSGNRPDALSVLDLDPESATYGQLTGRLDMPNVGDELHHFGWNACSAHLCPGSPHHDVERRYLLVPGLRSSRIHVVDTKPDPHRPRLAKVIEPDAVAAGSGYSRPHTFHCGPDGIYVSALGSPDGSGPGGLFRLDHETFDVQGQWETDRGPQYLAYDFWWHLGHNVLVSSEWGTPEMVENGLDPQRLLAHEYGHRIHLWDLRTGRHLQQLDLGAEHQMVLELRPAHNPSKTYGFVNAVVSTKDLSSSVWAWHRDNGNWAIRKVIEIPAEPADADRLPPALQPFGAVPPLVTDLVLSLDDRYLYVACWGTGDLRQYDVSDPFAPKLTGTIRLGGIVSRAPHPRGGGPLNGAPQMVELSRDGRRLYFSNSLYSSWDDQFYPDGLRGWIAKADIAEDGRMTLDENFFVPFEGERPHQIRLEGGDSSSDSYCYS
ncbi:selenium-binding protein SBP56-related protein [Amycolatopsis sp. VS8301801F10]|uniref:selenium-binding protein SBP56-related protein n=1 Tax=Amycolatopsis sp. VS8301801F10 TaxID=2652442 RepID=UPI0038FCF93E